MRLPQEFQSEFLKKNSLPSVVFFSSSSDMMNSLNLEFWLEKADVFFANWAKNFRISDMFLFNFCLVLVDISFS